MFALVVSAVFSGPDPVQPALESHPLTTGPEFEGRPALAPDGRAVAYLARTSDDWVAEVRTLDLAGAAPSVLATDALPDSAVRWSPDGAQVAYVRPSLDGLEIVRASSPGGEPDVLVAIHGRERKVNMIDSASFDWSGAGILFSARDAGDQPYYLALTSLDSGDTRRITRPPEASAGDTMPMLSPDGRFAAFARFSSLSECELNIIDLDNNRVRQLTSDGFRIWGFDWTPDSKALVYSSSAGIGHHRLWWRALDQGDPIALTGRERQAQYPTVSDSELGPIAVYQQKERWQNIWQSTIQGAAQPLIESTWLDAWPELAPDGRRVAFISQRSGAHEVWIADQRQEPIRLTELNGPYSDMPRFSPDGAKIAFSSADAAGDRDIYIVDVVSRRTTRFTASPSEEGRASWSRDGRWLYFRSDRSGDRQTWKRRTDGSGEPIQVTRGGGYEAFESPDGSTLYYIRSREQAELWSVSVDAGEEQLVLEGPREANWRVVDRGVVYLRGFYFELWDAAADRVETLYRHPKEITPDYGFAATPDASRLFWSQTDRNTSDIWLAEIVSAP